MIIKKVKILNFKSLRDFEIEFNNDINIIVGNNESGKSTILEAINLALNGQLNGRQAINEISPYIFNLEIVNEFKADLVAGNTPLPPSILIELYFTSEDPKLASFKGTDNSEKSNELGIVASIEFDERFNDEYLSYIENPAQVKNIPTEYFKFNWHSFSGASLTKRGIPITTTLIDASTIRLQYGTDYYIQKIINDTLDPTQRTNLSLIYRGLKESFSSEEAIQEINDVLSDTSANLNEKALSVSIDVSQKHSWETHLTAYLDEIPFNYLGKGEQNILKILLALERQVEDSNIILLEEPENHLSYSTMSKLIKRVHEKCEGKQLILTSHNTFILNKLGLEKVILIANGTQTNLSALSEETQNYFRKLPGFDTLRLVIAEKPILVEGPSDELIVQKAYMMQNEGKLPIEDGWDIITVRGLSFKRFLDISILLGKQVVVVTDNDGNYAKNITGKYQDYLVHDFINICADTNNDYPTLEPQIVNDNTLENINIILGKEFESK
ncbi:MAG TPA: ATP-dependent endonuclease, partial [Flavobacteriaceae bacterium]|nr:ATP-dependent endonuclease [Flavobacteriaceae bacterium]